MILLAHSSTLAGLKVDKSSSAKVQRWDQAAYGLLSEAAIRKLHTPPENYRISPSHYPPNTNFSGWMHSGQIYVIQGSCGYVFDGHDPLVLSAGDTARFPEGDYEMYVLGNEEVHLVLVWELPLEFRHPSSAPDPSTF